MDVKSFSLKGKVALVLGGAGDLGHAIAETFSSLVRKLSSAAASRRTWTKLPPKSKPSPATKSSASPAISANWTLSRRWLTPS